MGKVTDYLRKAIKKQIDEHGVVVLYDGAGHYTAQIDQLAPQGVPVFQYAGSFHKLRYEVEPHIELNPNAMGDVPHLLVYVPLPRQDTGHALIEIDTCGVVMQPGTQPPDRNTDLAYIARMALLPIVGESTTDEVVNSVMADKYTLAELDELAESGASLSSGQVRSIFKTDQLETVALNFLSDPKFDAKIIAKDALPEFTDFLAHGFGMAVTDVDSPAKLRQALARHILLVDLLSSLSRPAPASLEHVDLPEQAALRNVCIGLAANWRDSSGFRASYLQHADAVASAFQIESIAWEAHHLTGVHTFRETEAAFQAAVEASLLAEVETEWLDHARRRQAAFWSTQPEIKARWELIHLGGMLLAHCDDVERALIAKRSLTAVEIAENYLAPDGWHQLDALYRRMKSRWLDIGVSIQSHTLDQLVIRASERYVRIGADLAERFVRALQDTQFVLAGFERQASVFDNHVKPYLDNGKIAYIWVDALRYEMAVDLQNDIAEDQFESTLSAVVASVPTITEIGMASLLPNAERGQIIDVGGGKLALQIDEAVIKDRKTRVDYLQTYLGTRTFTEVKLDELRQRKKKTLNTIATADFVLVTSQDIDELGESGNDSLARSTMNQSLTHLYQGIQILRQQGIQRIVIAADHGHLFLDDVPDEMRVGAPGGNTADLHRRAWIGEGGIADSAVLRTPLRNFGHESNLDYATLFNFSCFRVQGGNTSYFHGGLSPQELLIPLLVIRVKDTSPPKMQDISWSLDLGTKTISSQLIVVTIGGDKNTMFKDPLPRVRVEVQMQGDVISKPISAGYGLGTAGNIDLVFESEASHRIESNPVTLLLDLGQHQQKTATILLRDADTGQELKSIKRDVTAAQF